MGRDGAARVAVRNKLVPTAIIGGASDEINRPVIRIASIQQPSERIVIDTNLPTIVPPPTLSADAATDEPPQQVRSSAPAISRIPVAAAEKRKPKKKQMNEVAANHPPSARANVVEGESRLHRLPRCHSQVSFLES
jgi:hypothetical protein